MKKMNFEKKWVIVTGASSGLGQEIAIDLAKTEKANLIIVARRTEKLTALKERIERESDSKVEILTLDLSADGSARQLFDSCTKEKDIYAVINNAGLTAYEIASYDNMATYEKILNLNLKTVIESTLLFLDYFKQKKTGGIMNVSSMLGLVPGPYQAIYSASKHGLSGFTIALIGENANEPVHICLYSPGGIKTEMVQTSGLEDKFGKNNIFNMDPVKAARKAVRMFKKRKSHLIPGVMNKAGEVIMRFIPKPTLAKMMEKSYRHKDRSG